MTSIEELATLAAATATSGAVRFINTQGLKADPEALRECLKANVNLRMGKALADAKQALECGMGWAAEQTFVAEMLLAGVDAAKECAIPVGMPWVTK